MKAILIAICFFIFNLCIGAVISSGIFEGGIYYESDYGDRFSELGNFTNLTKTDIEAQSTDAFQVIASVVTFNWVFKYTDAIGISDEIGPFILGLNILMLVIYAIAFIELFMKQYKILG